jgi:NAD-dependent deacetylase
VYGYYERKIVKRMINRERLARATELLAAAQNVFCLTGAGVSAESGIQTFRDAQTGLWSKLDPAQLASQAGFRSNPGLVWQWYMARLAQVESAVPNPGHVALAQLAALFPVFGLVTQNVDDLHERAGSSVVWHLHGSIARFACNACDAEHILLPDERSSPQPPLCLACGGLVRPGVVWFGESLPPAVLAEAEALAEQCDVVLVVGTSGIVYPAAMLPAIARRHGAGVIEVNPEQTPLTGLADHFLQGNSGTVLPALVELLLDRRD